MTTRAGGREGACPERPFMAPTRASVLKPPTPSPSLSRVAVQSPVPSPGSALSFATWPSLALLSLFSLPPCLDSMQSAPTLSGETGHSPNHPTHPSTSPPTPRSSSSTSSCNTASATTSSTGDLSCYAYKVLLCSDRIPQRQTTREYPPKATSDRG